MCCIVEVVSYTYNLATLKTVWSVQQTTVFWFVKKNCVISWRLINEGSHKKSMKISSEVEYVQKVVFVGCHHLLLMCMV